MEINSKKIQINSLLEKLPPIIEKSFLDSVINTHLRSELPSNPYKYLEKIIDWLDEFTPLSDDIGVTSEFNPFDISNQLTRAGFNENEGVGEDPGWFNTRQRMGRYIIGQVINCLNKGMPPHPITTTFIEKYRQLPEEE